MNVTVYCGAADGTDPQFTKEAYQLGKQLAKAGHTLVWGAGTTGLMGAVSRGVLENGGRAQGVIPEFLVGWEPPYEHDFDGRLQVEIATDMASRRLRMIELGDAFVTLPGGPGTLDEISEVWGLAKLRLEDSPLILLNTSGFYDGLLSFLDTMTDCDFVSKEVRQRMMVANDAQGVISLLK